MPDTAELRHTQGVEPVTQIDPAAVRAELERVLASPALAGSGRLSRLLRFVVERTLEGRGDEIKEYVLGTEVFDRGAEYDPRLDSIVRVEARRLRAKLDEYYAGPGSDAVVTIRLHRGNYVPTFEMSTARAAPVHLGSSEPDLSRLRMRPPAMWMALAVAMLGLAVLGALIVRSPVAAGTLPRVAVLPFSHFPADAQSEALADRITDGIVGELVRLGRLEIVSRLSTRQLASEPRSASEIAATLGASWLVEARVYREHDRVRVALRLVDPVQDRKVWADDFESGPGELRALERDAAAAIETAIRAR